MMQQQYGVHSCQKSRKNNVASEENKQDIILNLDFSGIWISVGWSCVIILLLPIIHK